MLHVVGVLLNVNQSGLLNQAVYIAIQIAPVGYYILEGVESMFAIAERFRRAPIRAPRT